MQVHHLRSATMLLSIGSQRLLVDPMLAKPGTLPGFKMFGGGRRPNPLVPLPSVADEVLAQASGVLVTHEHPDHLDGEAVSLIVARRLPVWASPLDVPSLRRKGLDARELTSGSLGLSVEWIPSRHGRGPLGWLMGPVAGWYLSHPDEPSVYLTSDAVLSESVLDALSRLRPDVVIAPAGAANFGIGPSILFTVDELVTLIRRAPHEVVLNHLEALDHCPTTRSALRERLEKEGLSRRVHIPQDGEVFHFARRSPEPHAVPGPGPSARPRLQKWVASRLG
jgi:L-ascorbate metabolism protein UlaG (beta-lactamase superfamily)